MRIVQRKDHLLELTNPINVVTDHWSALTHNYLLISLDYTAITQRQELLCLVHSGHSLLTSPLRKYYFCLILQYLSLLLPPVSPYYSAHRIALPLPPLHGTVGARMIQVEYRHKVGPCILTGREVSHIALQ